MSQGTEDPAVLVGVNGTQRSWDALEWATAEAAAANKPLHIIHGVEWPLAIGPLPDGRAAIALATGQHMVDEAVRRAQQIAPGLRITSEVDGDLRPGRAILRAAGNAKLIVLGRHRDGHALRSWFASSVGSFVTRRASVPVVVAGLADRASGLSAGRVAVLIDDDAYALDALTLAFRAAERRGLGVTVLHAVSTMTASAEVRTASLTAGCRHTYNSVDVVEEYLSNPARPSLAQVSQGAALVILGAQTSRHMHRAVLGRDANTVADNARTPVLIVPAVNAREPQRLTRHEGSRP